MRNLIPCMSPWEWRVKVMVMQQHFIRSCILNVGSNSMLTFSIKIWQMLSAKIFNLKVCALFLK